MIADQAGRTALLEAARSCNQGAVQAILAGSATEARNLARQEDFAGWNALHWAVRGNGIVGRDLMVVKAILCLLLESGADPEAFGSYQRGWTPAMLQDKAFTPMQLAQAMGEDMFEIWKEVWSDFVDGENDTFFDVEIL